MCCYCHRRTWVGVIIIYILGAVQRQLSNIAHWRHTNKLIRKHDYINVYDFTSTFTPLSRAKQKTIYIYVLSCLKWLLSRFPHVVRCIYYIISLSARECVGELRLCILFFKDLNYIVFNDINHHFLTPTKIFSDKDLVGIFFIDLLNLKTLDTRQ